MFIKIIVSCHECSRLFVILTPVVIFTIRKPPILQFRRAEVHEQAETVVANVEVVDELRLMLSEKCANGLYLNAYLAIAEEIIKVVVA